MARDKTRYACAREQYKKLYPNANIHHMMPVARGGSDTEFNLFPWNEKSHSAWNRLFCIMTIREVWSALVDAHVLIFQTDQKFLVREWCLPYRYCCKKPEQHAMALPQQVEKLREAWADCFGSADPRSAKYLLRYMMLHMVFGHHVYSSDVYATQKLCAMLAKVAEDPERAWAFRQCFGHIPHQVNIRSVKKIIRRVLSHAKTIPIH